MKPSQWPRELDNILAKSADRGGDTLAQHTWDVLEKLAALRDLRPTLPQLTDDPALWRYLFWTCLFHDFGKAARGFQNMLATKQRWQQRHEVLSLACFDWIAGGLSFQEQRYVVAAIVSHHRDARDIRKMYDDVDPDPLVELIGELDSAAVSGLWHWVHICAADWRSALGFAVADDPMLAMMPHDDAVALVRERGAARIRHWLRVYQDWVEELDEPLPEREIVLPVLLRGLTTTADHMASARLANLHPPVQEAWTVLERRILNPGQQSYTHQQASAVHSGRSALLIAPTGSGKTESALYWALGDGSVPVPRLFYALPYQASMNAMFDRLRDNRIGFGTQAVGLQHGRALQALYARLMDQEADVRSAVGTAKWAQNLNTLHARPIKVFSPYQMLKAAFQLRGFEAMLTDYAQAAFIFDEIHAYEPQRLALILKLIRHLRVNFDARFFVMSATFPQIIREQLASALALQDGDVIEADADLYRRFQRHRLHLLDGELLTDGLTRIVADVRRGKSVLACANTVRRAQALRRLLLAEGLPSDQVILIHSRFIIRDRTQREREILELCPIGATGTPVVLVATQVVEVSLNIDLDTVYSDPAPLEALLQRFGRVNRVGAKGICPVHIFCQPDDGQGVYGRSRDRQQRGRIVRVTLAELERHNGEIIDESATGSWLNAIYADDSLRREWHHAYQSAALTTELTLRELRPFNGNPQKEQDFDALFDNVDVLPQCFEQAYLAHLQNDEFIEASQYFVGISAIKYKQLARKGLVLPMADVDGTRSSKWMVRLPYSSTTGLSFEDTTPEDDGD